MKGKERAVAASVLFKGLAEPLLRQLTDIAVEKRFRRGEMIFTEGSASGGFYVVAEGQVKVFKMAPDGREHILYVLGPGEPFGLVPVFHGQLFPASASSMSAAVALFFPRPDFVALTASHPELALSVLSVQSQRMRRFAAAIESLALKGAPERLAAHLLYLSEQQKRRDQVVLDMPKKQLANLLGTSPETLSRIFSDLSAAGLIRVDGRQINLLSYSELQGKISWGGGKMTQKKAG
ncbi:Crp/Fnr family transcriptional regulator [Candidatus Electronema sp. JC]|uniref:Crp/Fnr family transcriptional regulator n=1 Tax=Candidatus Electronema sp. JC TaxID=3401570 RepID=UPI003AA938EC